MARVQRPKGNISELWRVTGERLCGIGTGVAWDPGASVVSIDRAGAGVYQVVGRKRFPGGQMLVTYVLENVRDLVEVMEPVEDEGGE